MLTIVGEGAHVARHVATALFNLDLHFDLAVVRQGGDHVIGVDDFDVVRKLDIGGQHGAGTRLAQHQGHIVTAVQLEHHALEVEQDIDDVFANAGDGRVFVHDTGDLDFRRRVAGHRGKQDAAQCVAQRMAVAALKGLHDDLGVVKPDGFDLNGARFEKTLRHDDYSFSIPSARYTDKADGNRLPGEKKRTLLSQNPPIRLDVAGRTALARVANHPALQID